MNYDYMLDEPEDRPPKPEKEEELPYWTDEDPLTWYEELVNTDKLIGENNA